MRGHAFIALARNAHRECNRGLRIEPGDFVGHIAQQPGPAHAFAHEPDEFGDPGFIAEYEVGRNLIVEELLDADVLQSRRVYIRWR